MKWKNIGILKTRAELFHQSVTTNLWMMKAPSISAVQHHVLHQNQAQVFLLQCIPLREDGQHLYVRHQHLYHHLLSQLQTWQ